MACLYIKHFVETAVCLSQPSPLNSHTQKLRSSREYLPPLRPLRPARPPGPGSRRRPPVQVRWRVHHDQGFLRPLLRCHRLLRGQPRRGLHRRQGPGVRGSPADPRRAAHRDRPPALPRPHVVHPPRVGQPPHHHARLLGHLEVGRVRHLDHLRWHVDLRGRLRSRDLPPRLDVDGRQLPGHAS